MSKPPRLPNPYTGKKDYTILVFLLVSVGFHLGAIYLGAHFTPPPPPPIDSTLDIELEGVENEPPPLGTNDTETGPPEPEPEPTPPPPEPEPEPAPPPPVVQPDFVIPEETPTPTPAPKPAATPRPKATPAATPGKPAAPSPNPNARPGAIRGVDALRGGVAGGTGAVKSKGGGRADFTSTPNLPVPYNIKQRLQGVRASAAATILYAGGSITDVNITKSSGNSSLDALIIRHVRSNYRVKSGASGKANLPIGIKL